MWRPSWCQRDTQGKTVIHGEKGGREIVAEGKENESSQSRGTRQWANGWEEGSSQQRVPPAFGTRGGGLMGLENCTPLYTPPKV